MSREPSQLRGLESSPTLIQGVGIYLKTTRGTGRRLGAGAWRLGTPGTAGAQRSRARSGSYRRHREGCIWQRLNRPPADPYFISGAEMNTVKVKPDRHATLHGRPVQADPENREHRLLPGTWGYHI